MTRPVFAPDLLAGKVALVTGGGTGIGFGIASCLAEAGAAVAIASRKPEHLEPAVARLQALGPRALAANAPGSLASIKRLCRADKLTGLSRALEAEGEAQTEAFLSPEFQRRLAAFLARSARDQGGG